MTATSVREAGLHSEEHKIKNKQKKKKITAPKEIKQLVHCSFQGLLDSRSFTLHGPTNLHLSTAFS